MKKPSPLIAVFFTVFFDILSFGVVIPDLQIRAESLTSGYDHNMQGVVIGVLLATYSVAQLLFGPWLGRVSDVRGRRPVLLLTCALSVVAALTYGVSQTAVQMALSRFVLGIAGANLGVAYAYISDVSTHEKRAASMGLVGMAFGLGFMLGPPLGAWLIALGGGKPFLLGLVSAAFGMLNLLFVALLMPNLPPVDLGGGSRGHWQRFKTAFQSPALRYLLVLFFVANLAFANLEATFYRLMEAVHHTNQQQTSWVLVFVGLVAAVMQGAVIPRAVKTFGEVKLLKLAYVIQSPTLAAVPFVPIWVPFLAGALLLGVGNGLAQPSLSSLVSRTAPPEVVGGVFGVTQSLGAMARIVGPIAGNALFQIEPWWPYVAAGVLMIVPMVMSQSLKQPELNPA